MARIALLLFLTMMLAACSISSEPPFQPALQGGPRLSFDRSTWDFAEVPAGKSLEAVFQLKNVGDRPLVIDRAITRVVEGCCPPQPELEATEIPSGKTSTLALQITMAESMTGPHVFEVLVSSNDPVEPEARLTAKAVYSKE